MSFYEIKVNYERQTGEDNPGKVRETYLLEGVNCADVEGRLLEELTPYVMMGSAIEVTNCRQVQYYDIVPSADPDADRWFRARVEMITVEDDGREIRRGVAILVQATDITKALKTLNDQLSVLNCEVIAIQRSSILEIYRAVK
ncbi:MAG: DUF4494 family protein [Paludibacteraceae bacterium]|nr:DUF4494 family protein [Paludibacteraceae bacterium]